MTNLVAKALAKNHMLINFKKYCQIDDKYRLIVINKILTRM